jgi:phosphoserine phosphatase RsbU/P
VRGYSWVGVAAGMTIITTFGVIDAVAAFSFLGAFALGAFVTALVASPRQVAFVGAYGLLWATMLGFDGEYWTTLHGLRIGVLVAGTGVAIVAATVRERYLHALIRTANVAEVAQQALLRPLAARYEEADLAVRYLSASEGALVGGDAYDAESTPWGLRVLVADVCGHGLEAVDKASSLLSAFREAAHTCPTLQELAARIEESFQRILEGQVDYASGLLLQIADGHVRIVNCGHPDPVLVKEQRAEWVIPPNRCKPFGLDPNPDEMRIALVGRDRLIVYTDGLIEARDRDGEFFVLEDHLLEAFTSDSLDEALDVLLGNLREHTDGRLDDDVVILALQPT